MDRQLLFVVGLARSGTTVLTELLNTHPDVALGMERFKQLFRHGAADDLGPDLFERDRFFDFTDGLTNITPDASPRWADYYRHLEEKYDAATYVGDKVTVIRIGRIVRRFPSARLVVIVRDPLEVAASWQRRADDPADQGWRSGNGARQAAAEWNRGLRRLLHACDHAPTRIRVVEHGSFFGDPAGLSRSGILDWLDLPPSQELDSACARMHAQFGCRVRDRGVELSPSDREAVVSAIDDGAWRAVTDLTSRQRAI